MLCWSRKALHQQSSRDHLQQWPSPFDQFLAVQKSWFSVNNIVAAGKAEILKPVFFCDLAHIVTSTTFAETHVRTLVNSITFKIDDLCVAGFCFAFFACAHILHLEHVVSPIVNELDQVTNNSISASTCIWQSEHDPRPHFIRIPTQQCLTRTRHLRKHSCHAQNVCWSPIFPTKHAPASACFSHFWSCPPALPSNECFAKLPTKGWLQGHPVKKSAIVTLAVQRQGHEKGADKMWCWAIACQHAMG